MKLLTIFIVLSVYVSSVSAQQNPGVAEPTLLSSAEVKRLDEASKECMAAKAKIDSIEMNLKMPANVDDPDTTISDAGVPGMIEMLNLTPTPPKEVEQIKAKYYKTKITNLSSAKKYIGFINKVQQTQVTCSAGALSSSVLPMRILLKQKSANFEKIKPHLAQLIQRNSQSLSRYNFFMLKVILGHFAEDGLIAPISKISEEYKKQESLFVKWSLGQAPRAEEEIVAFAKNARGNAIEEQAELKNMKKVLADYKL